MRRRIVLSGLGTMAAGLAGCISTALRDTSDDQPAVMEPLEVESRIDEPPYRIEEPTVDEDADVEEQYDQWDPHYLGEHQPTEPSLTFEPLSDVDVLWSAFAWPNIATDDYGVKVFADRQTVMSEWDILRDRYPEWDRDVPTELESIDFDAFVLVEIHAGAGSSMVNIKVSRVRETDEGIHVFGYLTNPFVVTADLGPRNRFLMIERTGKTDELTRVSLTRSASESVHFNSTEGPVTIS